MKNPRLPAWPVAELVHHRWTEHGTGLAAFAADVDLCDRTLFRVLRASEITLTLADEIAARLGTHLANLYPDLYRERISA